MLTISISTLNDRIYKIRSVESLSRVCQIMVIHQVTDGNNYAYGELEAAGARIFTMGERGLSVSRNYAIDRCETRYCWFMDDDVEINEGGVRAHIAAIEERRSPVVLCGHLNREGLAATSYPHRAGVMKRCQLAKFTSIDICADVHRLRKHGLRFDERFGLGTALPSGEELIFLSSCFDSGLQMYFVRHFPIKHPDVDSGQDFYSHFSLIDAKREMIHHVFGSAAFIIKIGFLLKKMPTIARRGHFMEFIRRFLLTK